MKKYKILMLLMIGIASITSCSDLVEEPIKLLASDVVFEEASDLQIWDN